MVALTTGTELMFMLMRSRFRQLAMQETSAEAVATIKLPTLAQRYHRPSKEAPSPLIHRRLLRALR